MGILYTLSPLLKRPTPMSTYCGGFHMLSKNSAISIGVLLGDGNDYIYICEFTVNVLEICNYHHLCARAQIVRLKS